MSLSPKTVLSVFAAVPVSDMYQSVAWYSRLIGRTGLASDGRARRLLPR